VGSMTEWEIGYRFWSLAQITEGNFENYLENRLMAVPNL
jgi:hypothetical protein